MGNGQHGVLHGVAGGQQHFGLVAHSLAQQSVAHGAFVADLAVQGVGFGAAHNVVLLVLVLAGHEDGDVGAHRDIVHAQLALINDDGVLDHLLQFGDAVLHQTLRILGLVVLAVLRQVENRITELEQTIKNAVLIDESELSVDNVSVGTHVTIRETGEDEAEEYDIVGRTEADAFNGKISDESPVGHALMGKAVGEKVEVLLPTGQTVEYTVLAITHSAN